MNLLFLMIAALATPSRVQNEITLALPEKESPSGLLVRSSLLRDTTFEFVTCETVLVGNHDLGLYQVAPKADDWIIQDRKWSYSWRLPEDLLLRFEAKPEGDSLRLQYTLVNTGKQTLERVQLHPCLPTLGARMFYPGTADQSVPGSGGRGSRVGMHDYTELWDRLYLWKTDGKFNFKSSSLAATEKHLAFLRDGEPPVEWSWWKNAEIGFDLPLIAATSKDSNRVLALAFEKSIWASSNAGDARACIHLFPYFGRLYPGSEVTVTGRLYIFEGGVDTALDRFRHDFPRD